MINRASFYAALALFASACASEPIELRSNFSIALPLLEQVEHFELYVHQDEQVIAATVDLIAGVARFRARADVPAMIDATMLDWVASGGQGTGLPGIHGSAGFTDIVPAAGMGPVVLQMTKDVPWIGSIVANGILAVAAVWCAGICWSPSYLRRAPPRRLPKTPSSCPTTCRNWLARRRAAIAQQ